MIGDPRYHESLRSPPKAVARSLADLTHDISVLFELQTRLFKAELEDSAQKIVWPIVMFVVAAIVLLSSVPLLLTAFAYVLVEYAELSHSLAFLSAAGLGLVVAGVLATIGYFAVKNFGMPFSQSQVELKRNLDWFRGHLKPSSVAADARSATPVN